MYFYSAFRLLVGLMIKVLCCLLHGKIDVVLEHIAVCLSKQNSHVKDKDEKENLCFTCKTRDNFHADNEASFSVSLSVSYPKNEYLILCSIKANLKNPRTVVCVVAQRRISLFRVEF